MKNKYDLRLIKRNEKDIKELVLERKFLANKIGKIDGAIEKCRNNNRELKGRRNLMVTCKDCGKMVDFKFICGTNFPIESKKLCFVPNENGSELFVNNSGSVMKGDKAYDGQYGYILHTCKKK